MPKYHGDICYILLTQRPTLGWPCNKQAPPYSSFYSLSKQLEQSRNSLPLIPTGPPSKERKTLNPPLPLTPTSLAATRKSFSILLKLLFPT